MRRADRVRCLLSLFIAPLLAGAGVPTERYFPPSELASDLDDSLREGFARHFAGIDEPALFAMPGVRYAVRVAISRCTGVTILRIERKSDGEITSNFRKFSFLDTGINPKPISSVVKKLTPNELARLSAEVQRQDFFTLDLPPTMLTGGNTIWMIEVFDGTKYHAAFELSQDPGTPFGDIAAVAAEIAHVTY